MAEHSTAGDLTSVKVEVELVSRLNLAMFHNAVPLIRRVTIINDGERALADLTVSMWDESGIVPRHEIEIAGIGAGARHVLDDVDLPLSPDLLVRLTEREITRLQVEVHADGDVLWRGSIPLEVLAYNEWNGASSLPELLAAFVMPNHPALQRIPTAASQRLVEWGEGGSLSGYQEGDPSGVRKTAAAIYHALADCGVRYANPPASFEETGQKIRTPDQVFDHRLATCLDISVLLAGALEQVGLHPLLLLVEGHAFLGVWLDEVGGLPVAATDDPLPIRKRFDAGDLIVFDSSSAVNGVPFEQAESTGRAHLQDTGSFRLAIDVAVARSAGIRPLPLRGSGQEYVAIEPEDARPVGVSAPDDRPVISSAQVPVGARHELTRVDRWKARLLDLSLRNRLLNFRPTKQTLPLLCADLPTLEDRLADGTSFTLHPRPDAFGALDPRDLGLLAHRSGDDPQARFLLEQQGRGHLHVPYGEAELERRSKAIFRAARTSIEETGANTLYVALGFLRWFERKRGADERMAPLLMLPAELRRDSARSPYQLRLSDDDPRVNSTLLQLMQQPEHRIDVAGLDELPRDDHGLDVPLIFQRFRRATLDIEGWEVVEEARLGLFSFTKLLMWLDLEERSDSLMENPVVHRLLAKEGERVEAERPLPDAANIDQRHASSMLCPMDANSSQLAAVYGAAEGGSYVLQGPPGTGKSQTITNLVAHSLANGKTVLFVSEKMAALNVVHERLRRIDLGPFCLQLHSDKTRKAEIARQLGEALAVSQSRQREEWETIAERLQVQRTALNGYVDALHSPRSIGRSYYDGIAALVTWRDAPRVEFDLGDAGTLDATGYSNIEDVVAALEHVSREIGQIPDHPWRETNPETWSAAHQQAVMLGLRQLDAAAADLQSAVAQAAPHLRLPADDLSPEQLATMGDLAAALCRAPAVPRRLLTAPDWPARKPEIAEWIKNGQQRDQLREQLAEHYTDRFYDLPLGQLRRSYRTWSGAVFLLAWVMLFFVSRRIAAVSRSGRARPSGRVLEDLDAAIEVQERDAKVAQAQDAGAATLEFYWRGTSTDWATVERLVQRVEHLRPLLGRVAGWDTAASAARRDHLADLASAGAEVLGEGTGPGHALRELVDARDKYESARSVVVAQLTVDESLAWDGPNYLTSVRETVGRWMSSEQKLRNWTSWVRAARQAESLGLAPLVHALRRGELDSDQLVPAFQRAFYVWWTARIAAGDSYLATFTGIEHNRQVELFRELDREAIGLARQQIRAQLAAKVPRDSSKAGGEMAVLRREIKKKRRHLPTRQLFKTIPHVLQRLKPCVLMSPLSVAQYLDPQLEGFDLVVFDEASQIPPWDAVGAIARGSQVIVVGDSKQLPPTTFFQRAESDDDPLIDEDRVDLESILDECIASGLPTLSLNWHFRSRHESLIAFSNRKYYEGELQTFPSAEMDVSHLGVKWRFVADGLYDKGRTRQNRAEADALVAEVVRRLRDPKRFPGSIGIVTFSQAQQMLIEDLLDEARQSLPEIEDHFLSTDDDREHVFVKNLENVQGDERDVMFFSIGYGPDREGRIAMNFGPLNRAGGERRLNVAITRARRQLMVFSSLHGDQIDLNRTRAEGVADLRDFLLFAEKGPGVLAPAGLAAIRGDGDLPIEREVKRALEARGHQVDLHVGCMDYRVDLGIKDPEQQGCYLLGIECDGPMYGTGRGARDRDRLRWDVLVDLGWNLHRVWALDWWHDPQGEVDRIERALEGARESALERATSHAEPDSGASAQVSPVTANGAPQPVVRAVPGVPGQYTAEARDSRGRTPSPDEEEVEPRPPDAPTYRAIILDKHFTDFYEPESQVDIARDLARVLHQEGPIHIKLATRRIADAWSLDRATKRVVRRVEAASQLFEKWKPRREGEFLWRVDQNPAEWSIFRVPGDRRPAELIPPEEIANAALAALEASIAAPRSELARATARLLGIQRMGKTVTAAMEAGIDVLAGQGRCELKGDDVVVCQEND